MHDLKKVCRNDDRRFKEKTAIISASDRFLNNIMNSRTIPKDALYSP